MALRAYSSPGVTVTESVNPAVASLVANPSLVAIVGTARGNQTATERLVLTGTTPVTLRYTGVTNGSATVKTIDGLTVNPGAYIVAQGADPNASIAGDEPWTLARVGTPATAPTVATTAGTQTGTYHYKVTFVNASGETGPGPASNDIVLAGNGTALTAIPVGTGTPTITGRNIYREKVVASVGQGYHLIGSILDNTTTIFTDNVTDVTAANGAAPPTGIASGDTVVITYTYTNQNYYLPTRLSDYDDVVDKYGSPFDANGNISSTLSFAARLAFLNGASEVVTVAQATTATVDLDAALSKLENQDGVRIVAVTDGTASGHSSVVAHVNKMNAQGQYRFAVLGRDGTATAVTEDTMRAASTSFNNEAVQLVNETSFRMQNPVTSLNLNVGGQYMGVALAGMWAGRDVFIPLTRQTVAGFMGINDTRSAASSALDSGAGLVVIEDKGGNLVIRHSVTTAVGSLNSREASVVRAKYDMAARLKSSLDSAIIGQVIPMSRAPLAVQSSVAGILEGLLSEGVIGSYSDLKARVLTGDPTTIEVKFAYTPSYPINNVIVVFTINVNPTDGDFSFTTT